MKVGRPLPSPGFTPPPSPPPRNPMLGFPPSPTPSPPPSLNLHHAPSIASLNTPPPGTPVRRRPRPPPSRWRRFRTWPSRWQISWRWPWLTRKPMPRICPNCMIKPVSPRSNGGFFNYCSKVCAAEARASDICEQCKLRPKFKNGGKVHPYCGKRCANLAANPPAPKKSRWIRQRISSGGDCQTPGCSLPVYTHQDGTPSKYCSLPHEEWGDHGCISCRAAPMSETSVLCQPCHEDALTMAPVIIKVPEDHKNYRSVEGQFKQTWRHNTNCPDVKAIYKIIVTEASLRQYQEHQENVESRGNFVALGKSPGNENRRWHGTRRKCRLGDPGHTSFCAEAGCALCCIIKSSFDIKFFKAATGWGRFGHGIYTSSTSSKSNDYSKNVGFNSDWKALLLNKVVVGNGKKLINDDTSLTEPPPGFDSVLAEVAPGGSLNYDELVVYHNDAVRPSYLVMYKTP